MTTSLDLHDWLPVRIDWKEPQAAVEWCWFGPERLTEPFFHESVEQRFRHPFNLLFRPRTGLEVLAERAAAFPGIEPQGFIFHMSRCGSTLLSQLLATSPRNLMVSEPPPVDNVLRSPWKRPGITDEDRVQWLRWVVSALGQPRGLPVERLFLKFDCWHIFDLPLIRRAYPAVPWIFVIRDPVEVLVSHSNRRGIQMFPQLVEPEIFGLDAETARTMPFEVYGAKVLGSLCQAAAHYCRTQGGQVVAYPDLPALAWTGLDELFRVSFTAAEVNAMQQKAGLDAKNPFFMFVPDSETKQTAATEAIRAAVGQWAQAPYEALRAVAWKAT
ncbi:MAG: sulfotransferase family protein [Blastocatellia bacterium]|nr:sulfotransferase family protein [Blastocatellia bacterium]